MRPADHTGKIPGERRGFLVGKPADFDLEILGLEFS
jgi:hypothetical protein